MRGRISGATRLRQNGPVNERFRQGKALPAATIVAALAALAVFVNWIVEHPPVSDPKALHLPLMVSVVYQIGERTGTAVTNAILALIATTGAGACALAIVLAWKSAQQASARRLAIALASISLCVAFFYFVLPHAQYRQLWQALPAAPAQFVLELAGYALFAAGLWQLGAFFEIYPRPIAPNDWADFVRDLRAKDQRVMRAGWRAKVYGRKWKDAGEKSQRGIYLDRWQGPHGGRMIAALLFGAAAVMALAGIYERQLTRAPVGHQDPAAMLYAAMAGVATAVFILSLGRDVRILQFHQARGLPDDRLRIEWILSTTIVGALFALGIVMLGMLSFSILTLTAGEELVKYSGDLFMMLPIGIAVPIFAASFLVAVTLSIFYRGAVDPRLAARKVTVWWLLGAAVALLFVLIERAVAVRVVQWLGLPSDTGPVIAGALVAATIAPVRQHAENSVTALVGRFLPIEQLMDGERKRVAVAMSDLSGYTALSVRDEKQALLIAALLHRNASVISQAHGGRMVKSIGDAVMLEFPDADSAAAALTRLHAEFPAACRAMGFEPLPVHSGAHVGEVVVGHDKDLFGQTVNLAARLQGEAKAGQIVVSDAFIADQHGAHSNALGPRRLKNIPEAVDCHELTVLS